MKKMLLIPLLCLLATTLPACSEEDGEPLSATERPAAPEAGDTPARPEGNTRTLVAYFSATGNTRAVAERIAELTGADVWRLQAADRYADNPYDDSDRIQREAYGNLRPRVEQLPEAEWMVQYDTLFVGSPIWWHQPAMVVCTFLEAYDLTDKVVIPFFTYGATTYLNESMQKIYRMTPRSAHILETLPEDLAPDDITSPGPADDAGIDMPGSAAGTEAWLRRMGIIE